MYDFSEANAWWKKISEVKSEKWEDHRKIFSPVFHDLRTQLCDECPNGIFHSKYKIIKRPKLQNHQQQQQQNINTKINLQTIQLITTMGLENFCQVHNIIIHRHSKYPNLIFFQHEKKRLEENTTNTNNTITNECNGLILDENNNWNIVCLPYYKVSIF